MEGKTEYLNKLGFKLPFLDKIYNKMVYQMENLNLEDIRELAEYYVLKAEAAVTNNSMVDFEANLIKTKLSEKIEEKQSTLNDFIDTIELTLNCYGTINPEKISAGRAYSLYHRAKEKNKRLSELNRKKHVNNYQ